MFNIIIPVWAHAKEEKPQFKKESNYMESSRQMRSKYLENEITHVITEKDSNIET